MEKPTVVNVKDFGFSETGTPDENMAAMERAVKALPEGGHIYIPEGTFPFPELPWLRFEREPLWFERDAKPPQRRTPKRAVKRNKRK